MAATQLSFADTRPRGPSLAVLSDGARVEDRLLRVARPLGVVAGKSACSIADLEREVVRAAGVAVAPPLAVSLALRQAARSHTVGPYFAIREREGYARALAGLLAALSNGLLSPDELAGLEVPPRVRALAQTLKAARALLQGAGLLDPGAALREAIGRVERGGPLPRFVAVAREVDLDILDWTPLRLRLAAALARRLRVRIRLPLTGQPGLDEAVDPALRALEKLNDGPAPEVMLADPAEGPLAPFARRLFAGAGETVDAPVELISCASSSAQAREAARQCAALLRAGAPPESIAVVAGSLEDGATGELRAAFEGAGVPLRDARGRAAVAATPVRLALSLYDLVENHFPREPLIELLGSRLLRLGADGERLSGQLLARTLREAGVRDDQDGAIADRLAIAAARPKADPQVLAEVRERTLRAVREVRKLPASGTFREHGRALLDLLSRFGLQRGLAAVEPAFAGRALSRAAALAVARDHAGLRALEEACTGAARAAAQLGLEDDRISRAAYARFLAATFSDSLLPMRGARGGSVELLELRQVPGRSFRHLVVVGLCEGELPASPRPDALLSDEEKRAVNQAARRSVFQLPRDGAARDATDALHLYLALGSGAATAALLWPRADAKGREILRSPFADAAVRALRSPVREAPLAPIPQAMDGAAASDLLARAALDAFAEPAFRVSPPAEQRAAGALLAAVAHSPLRDRLLRIARAARAERERARVFIREIPPGRFSGQLSGAALDIAARAFAFGRDAPASAHQLEENARCAFRTLAGRLLRLSADEEVADELTKRQQGSLLHRCLERFFRSLDGPLQGTPAEDRLLVGAASAELSALEQSEHVGNPVLWEIRRETVIDQLRQVVASERGKPLPLEIERRFGYDEPDSWPPLELPALADAGSVFVRGMMDRVDRRGDVLLVVDYKSSRASSLRTKLRAANLFAPEMQLALYAALLQKREPSAAVDAEYFSLRDAARTATLRAATKLDLDVLLELDPARRREAAGQQNLADEVHRQVALMRAGRFEVRPLTCDYCNWKSLCRVVALPTDPEENGSEVSRA
jgi:RecB family exonuclease